MAQYAGYVSEVRFIPGKDGDPYGSSGYLQVELTCLPHGHGEKVNGSMILHLTRGASIQSAAKDFLLTENQLLTLLLAYSAAAANGTRVRINTHEPSQTQIMDVAFTTK